MEVPDRRAFEEAFGELLRVAYRAAIRITGDAAASEDAAAEALARAALRWERVSERAGPWVVRVASNLAIDHLRRAARRKRLTLDRSDATLPSAAVDTGYDRDGIELHVDPADPSAVWLAYPDGHVEQWPLADLPPCA